MNRRKFLSGVTVASLVPLVTKAGVFPVGYRGKSTASHRILCCNIRVALDEDEVKGVGWSSRRDICLRIIEQQQPDIIALQEVLKIQADDFRKYFDGFQLFSFDGPEMDAHATGYHGIAKNPIMFSAERYELQSGGTYWLSDTPLAAGSKSWDTARARHANWVRLRDRSSGKVFRVVNTHLDHVSNEAKIQQAKMIVEESDQYQPNFPQILTGDFNTRHNSDVLISVRQGGWQEAYETIHGVGEAGYTGHSFEGKRFENGSSRGRIDYIWYKGNVQPTAASIIKDDIDGKYPSDHFFISADVSLT